MGFASVPKLSQISKVNKVLKKHVYNSVFWDSDLNCLRNPTIFRVSVSGKTTDKISG